MRQYDKVRAAVRADARQSARLVYSGEPKPANPYRRADYRGGWESAFWFELGWLVWGESGSESAQAASEE